MFVMKPLRFDSQRSFELLCATLADDAFKDATRRLLNDMPFGARRCALRQMWGEYETTLLHQLLDQNVCEADARAFADAVARKLQWQADIYSAPPWNHSDRSMAMSGGLLLWQNLRWKGSLDFVISTPMGLVL